MTPWRGGRKGQFSYKEKAVYRHHVETRCVVLTKVEVHCSVD